MKSTKPSHALVMFAVLLAVCVVVLGAFTRLRDAGLGCPDWPTCYWHYMLWPETPEEIAAANAAHPDFPFEAAIAWPEVVHRYFAAALGFIIILINVVAWQHRKERSQPLVLPLVLVASLVAVALNAWGSPIRLNVTYLNPAGSASSRFPDWSGVGLSSPYSLR